MHWLYSQCGVYVYIYGSHCYSCNCWWAGLISKQTWISYLLFRTPACTCPLHLMQYVWLLLLPPCPPTFSSPPWEGTPRSLKTTEWMWLWWFFVILMFCNCVFTIRPPSTAKSVSIGDEDPTLQLDCKGESSDAIVQPLGGIMVGPRVFKPRQSSVRSSGNCSALLSPVFSLTLIPYNLGLLFFYQLWNLETHNKSDH